MHKRILMPREAAVSPAFERFVPQTPGTVTPALRAFARMVLGGAEPTGMTHVPCRPRKDGAVNECVVAADAQVREYGGAAVHGWAIWEHPKVLLEAEFHAVWRDRQHRLLDVVGRGTDTRSRILFVPDPIRRYQGTPVDTVRHPLVADPRMDELLRASEEIYEMWNGGDRATQVPSPVRGSSTMKIPR